MCPPPQTSIPPPSYLCVCVFFWLFVYFLSNSLSPNSAACKIMVSQWPHWTKWFPQPSSVGNSSQAMTASLIHVKLWVLWSCPGNCRCCELIQKMAFYRIPPDLLAQTFFPPLLLQCSLSLGRVDTDVSFRTETSQSPLFSIWTSYESALTAVHCRRKLLCPRSRAPIYIHPRFPSQSKFYFLHFYVVIALCMLFLS